MAEEGKRKLIYTAPAVNSEWKEAVRREVALPKHPEARRDYFDSAKDNFEREGDAAILGYHRFPRNQISYSAESQILRKTGSYRDAVMARPRYYDPIRSYTLIGIPFQMQLEQERVKIRQWCRFYMMTHHLVPTCIEIFSRFPLIGFENTCKDTSIKEFYDELFLDENRLNYKNFLVQMGLEYWTVGEAFPFGDWNDDLGVWVTEQLMDPDLMEVQYFPILKRRAFKMKIPEHLKNLITSKEPREEYEALQSLFPEIIPFISRNEPIPIDSTLMNQIRCGGADWETHGTPILMRAFRQLMLEEKLNMSQMAVAERLFLPLLIGKLGAGSFGDNQFWIPTDAQIQSLRDDVELAMSSDFRFISTHWAVEFESVFGREVVPDMTADYDQIERRILSIFGISESLISGQATQPYASTALNADFLNQRLKSYQDELKAHIADRYRAVAAAQGFYDYEKKGDRLVPIYEEHLIVDPETGEKKKELRRKLLYPTPVMRVMDLRDEQTQRDFLFNLKEAGVPIADSTMMIGVEFEFDGELDKQLEEENEKIIRQMQAHKQLFQKLKEANLPIPGWLREEIAGIPSADEQKSLGPEAEFGGPPALKPVPGPGPEGANIPGAIKPMEGEGGPPETTEEEKVIKPLPQNKMRPEESEEGRELMPKPPASLGHNLRKLSEDKK